MSSIEQESIISGTDSKEEGCLGNRKRVIPEICYVTFDPTGCYENLRVQEDSICQEIAIKSLLVLNDHIFDADMPVELRLRTETEGTTDIFKMFGPPVNGRLIHSLLLHIPGRLRAIARIMWFIWRKFSTKDSYKQYPGDYHPNISKRIATEMVNKRFGLPNNLADQIRDFINSDPKYKAESIFCDSDEKDESKIDRARLRVQEYEDTRKKIVGDLIKTWESDLPL